MLPVCLYICLCESCAIIGFLFILTVLNFTYYESTLWPNCCNIFTPWRVAGQNCAVAYSSSSAGLVDRHSGLHPAEGPVNGYCGNVDKPQAWQTWGIFSFFCNVYCIYISIAKETHIL